MKMRVVFALLCLSWGTTWLAIKVGVETAPPLWFAGTRFLVAGVLLLAWRRARHGALGVARRDLPAVAALSVLVIAVTFGLIFWGEQYVSSGLTAVLVQGLVPVGLYGFALAHRHARFEPLKGVGIALGLVGLLIVFLPTAAAPEDARQVSGIAAITVGTLVYCWASVKSRDVLTRCPPLTLSGYENLVGGAALVVASLSWEGTEVLDVASYADGGVVAAWLYLVVVGSIVGFTAYVYLLGEWGPARVSVYAFVTPLIALAAGVGLRGEVIEGHELAGSAVILVSVWMMTSAATASVARRVSRAELTTAPADTK